MPDPILSICVPIHDMKNGDYFLSRLLNSLQVQTFRDFEIVITKQGKMAENTNEAMRRAKGDFIKILYMDDCLAHPNALQNIVDRLTNFTTWLATGCVHTVDGVELINPHVPTIEGLVQNGENSIGSPSVITLKNMYKDPTWPNPPFFDENMSWLLDVDFYQRLFNKNNPPVLLNTLDVVIGIGEHQMTNILTDNDKISEANYFKNKNK